ncbi:MAG: hypothetical protein HOE36_07265 [Flavobacteriaceae bacterium]|jgi:hypothetical protein|nr:hypothetical protein [Flavobacteriaceae bacterium]
MPYAVPMWAGAGNVSAAAGPTGVSVATDDPLAPTSTYDNAFVCYRVGSGAQVFEDGSSFSSGTASASIPEADFAADRDRSIGFGCYARATTSGGTMTYSWTVTETTAFPTGSLTSTSYNNQQDNTSVTPDGSGGVSGGVGPYVLFTSAPSVHDSGVYKIKVAVTDNNGTTNSTECTVTMTFV